MKEDTETAVEKEDLNLKGAEMVLNEAIKELRNSVHPHGCEAEKEGDDVDGMALYDSICKHREEQMTALNYWERCLRHRNSFKPLPGC